MTGCSLSNPLIYYFMHRQEFISLLQRYLDGTCSPSEKQTMDYWYDLLNQEYDDQTHPISKADLEDALWDKIQARIEPEQLPVRSSGPTRQLPWWKAPSLPWLAAASVVILIGISYFIFLHPQWQSATTGPVLASKHLRTEKNNGPHPTWITLADGSRVQLTPGSSLQFPSHFASNQRAVYLTGNAFFTVNKDIKRPFLVYCGDIVTRVVGTSFHIRSDKEDLEVSVVTGKVVVEKAHKSGKSTEPTEGVLLTPNQKVTYYASKNYFVTGLIDNPVPLPQVIEKSTDEQLFQFEDTPLKEVLMQMETAYGLNIVLVNEDITHCPITADLSRQTLYTKLNIICAALEASYEIKGTNIILSGGNCE